MSNQPNISWPGWEVVQLLGRGSFGAVYEIRRTLFDDEERAALKVISIPPDESDVEELYGAGYDDETITATFRDHLKSVVAEYSLMRRMNGHSNIVNCDDVSYIPHAEGFGWDIYIKMELLTPLLKTLEYSVPEETVKKIACDLCRALVLCKKYDILHRDIKPQNIFVSPNGDYKLGDFGIAKTVEKTMGGTRIGTYRYMAPEVYNNQPYGAAADIYSLGLVLYQLLNERRLPFMPLPPEKPSAGQETEARRRRLAGEAIPDPLRGSEELKKIVLKACAYEPKDRFASAEEMLRALEELDRGTVVQPVIHAEPISVSPVPEDPVQPEVRPTSNIGFSSADEMLEALGISLSRRKKETSVQPVFHDIPETGLSLSVAGSGGDKEKTQSPSTLPMEPLFRDILQDGGGQKSTQTAADEMLEALGMESPYKKKKPVEPIFKDAPQDGGGQKSTQTAADEMLEALGMESPYKKKEPVEAIFKDVPQEAEKATDTHSGKRKHRWFPW